MVTLSQACVCSPLSGGGAGGQMVAEMGPNPASAGQARGMTPKVMTPPSRVSVPCCEPLEATGQPSEQTQDVPGGGRGPWSPSLQDPILLGRIRVEFCQGGLLASPPTPPPPGSYGSITSVWPFLKVKDPLLLQQVWVRIR